MTPKEAIECLKNEKLCILIADKNECTRECSKCGLVMETDTLLTAYDMAIEALEKQIPKKSLKLTYKPLIAVGWIYACPNCKMVCGENKYHYEATSDEMYCPSCGQALDWSEEE